MATLYAFKNFNNYYNRKLKKYEDLVSYPEPDFIETDTYLNFNPNDGINTTLVLGRSGNNPYLGDCDYLIYSADNVSITSRWFIIEQQRKLIDQYQVTIHRDVLADNWDKILNSDCFIEKANLTVDNPLIFNKEDMTTNQIKKDQALLYDKTLTPWIIGYLMTKDSTGADTNWRSKLQSVEISASADPLWTVNYDDISQYVGAVNKKRVYSKMSYETGGLVYEYGGATIKKIITGTALNTTSNVQNVDWYGQATNGDNASNIILFHKDVWPYWSDFDINLFNNKFLPQQIYLSSALKNYVYAGGNDTIDTYNNKIVKQTVGGRNIYYKISVIEESEQNERLRLVNSDQDANYNIYINLWNCVQAAAELANEDYERPVGSTAGSGYITRYYNYKYLSLTPITVDAYQFKDTIGNVKETRDALYLMFAMPYSATALKFASNIRNDLGSQVCVDIQILPYFPRQEIIDTTKPDKIDRTGLTISVDYDVIDKTDATLLSPIDPIYLYWCPDVSFEVTEFSFASVNNILSLPMQASLNPIKKKINSQCDSYRLVSPNGNGVFEFNLEFNGDIPSFNADCTYRPINPYLHINPLFSGLYGQDFNDYRGLICQGDFSIPLADSAWVQYENNNKNFQNIFNRQIEHMEINNSIQKTREIAGVLGGAVGGVASGAIVGSMFPGVGTAVGAIGGAALSGLGGIADIALNEKLRSEAIDYSKDQFGYQLGNIRAVPQSLVKTGSLNPNNPLVPYIEFYTCTDVEKTALKNKIRQNGMTVMAIGQLKDYIDNEWEYDGTTDRGYVKSQLILFEDADEDFHNVNAIAEELNKGVYTK